MKVEFGTAEVLTKISTSKLGTEVALRTNSGGSGREGPVVGVAWTDVASLANIVGTLQIRAHKPWQRQAPSLHVLGNSVSFCTIRAFL